MKLFNPALAGVKFKTSKGIVEVGADGSVEVDESVAKVFLNSGFKPKGGVDKPKAVAQPRQPEPVVEEKKEEVVEPEPVVDDSIVDEETEEEIEIEDIGEYSAKNAKRLIEEADDLDVLKAWQESEENNSNRKTVLKMIADRIAEVS